LNSQLPSLDALRCFLAAARTLNFRKAARAVALTPAALGQRIRALEEQLGSSLFVRTTRSVLLTEAGTLLVPKAETALHAASQCMEGVVDGRSARGVVELTVGTRYELGMSWVLPAMRAFEGTHAWGFTHLYFGNGDDLLLRVLRLEVDCAITSTRFHDPRLEALQLHSERYLLVGSKKLLLREPIKTPADTEQHTLLDIDGGTPLFRYYLDGLARRPEKTRRKVATTGDRPTPLRFARVRRLGTIAAIREMVQASEGIAVLPEYFVQPLLAKKELLTILPEVELASDAFRLVYRRDDPKRARYTELTQFLRKRPLT
jgi:LysR family transcriptional regulator, glycine cleavage system transcriptional activator